MDDLTIYTSPEEAELAAKKAELGALESELAENELKLATFQAELHGFEQQYLGLIGSRYTELERVEAQITEYMDYLESSRNFKPSDGLKKLYREVAKRVHPDLATDEVERVKRQDLMAAANQAYEEGDEQRLREILASWESDPHSVQGEGVAAELIRVIRQIAQCRSRLVAISRDMEALKQTELFELKEQVEQAQQSGQDLLAEMAKHLDEQIAEAQDRLQDLKEQLGV
ncbi:molecular chaperone DnaJ [Synechocystis sp. PCC 7339]|nr:molecular chaperone DnaJ [Synechocystis sp. PCC 7338]UAJ74380.1 molecular chaperone DnaJ [Synechocystis sp. PCC 7339]